MEKGLLSTKSLAEYLDMSLSAVYLLRDRPDFPKPVSFDDSWKAHKYWRRAAIDSWLKSLEEKGQETA